MKTMRDQLLNVLVLLTGILSTNYNLKSNVLCLHLAYVFIHKHVPTINIV